MRIRDRLGNRLFQFVHRRNLVYNTCWEDPRLDRAALDLAPSDRVAMITSAGCNALDYALNGPASIDCVDMNPSQNALLELKLAGIGRLEFEDFFKMFGEGRLPGVRDLYESQLRPSLSSAARKYWDRHIGFFDSQGARNSFYFRGTAGWFAWIVNGYINRLRGLRDAVQQMLAAADLEEQRAIYEKQLKPRFWRRPVRWAVGRDATLSLLGVPPAQRHQVEKNYPGGITHYIEDCLDGVFANLPLADNYFWRVYLTGRYSRDCCPEYLKPDNFQLLKLGLASRIRCHTMPLTQFLRSQGSTFSRFVLLDHMDWLSTWAFPQLEEEWQAILDGSAPKARILWRSGGLHTEFVDRACVWQHGRRTRVGELLTYDRELASRLHAQDRVHTYGSFSIATLVA